MSSLCSLSCHHHTLHHQYMLPLALISYISDLYRTCMNYRTVKHVCPSASYSTCGGSSTSYDTCVTLRTVKHVCSSAIICYMCVTSSSYGTCVNFRTLKRPFNFISSVYLRVNIDRLLFAFQLLSVQQPIKQLKTEKLDGF